LLTEFGAESREINNTKVVIFRPFHKVQTHPHTANGSGVMFSASWGAAEI
jgi:hypothetical protein